MYKHSRFYLIITSALAAGSLLAGCSGNSNGVSESAKVASATTSASAASQISVAPVAYVPEPVAAVVSTCNIEKLDEMLFQSVPLEASLSAKHSVDGWIATPKLSAPSFWLHLDDKVKGHYFQVQVTPSIKRPDVASSASNPPLPLSSGFALELPVGAIPAGRYHLYLAARADGKSSICDDGRQVDFK